MLVSDRQLESIISDLKLKNYTYDSYGEYDLKFNLVDNPHLIGTNPRDNITYDNKFLTYFSWIPFCDTGCSKTFGEYYARFDSIKFQMPMYYLVRNKMKKTNVDSKGNVSSLILKELEEPVDERERLVLDINNTYNSLSNELSDYNNAMGREVRRVGHQVK